MKRGLSQFFIAAQWLAVVLLNLLPAKVAFAGAFVLSTPLTQPHYLHTATLLNDGRVLVAGGFGTNGVSAVAELRDPVTGSWTLTGSMKEKRNSHIAVRLGDGRVLCIGGGLLTSAEIYDPATGIWTSTGSMLAARLQFGAVLLPNSKVLINGGNASDFRAVATTEIYDAATGKWTASTPMSAARIGHTTTLLPDGRVLVIGGVDASSNTNATAELYDSTTGMWQATSSPRIARAWHTATPLPDGRILVAGGDPLNSAEIYNPTSETWSATGPTLVSHASGIAVLLSGGGVMIAGRYESIPSVVSSVTSPQSEVWDSRTGTWSATGNLQVSRGGHTVTVLPNGQVLIAGGAELKLVISSTVTSRRLSDTELYDPQAVPLWLGVGTVVTPRFRQTATRLADGKVMVAGGATSPISAGISDVEAYDPSTETWSVRSPMTSVRRGHTMTLLADGKVLVVGGNPGTNTAIAELYDPLIDTWSQTLPPQFQRANHTATRLLDGKVLISGGSFTYTNGFQDVRAVVQAELYDPVTGIWTVAGQTNHYRAYHQATLLANGKVLVTGGAENSFIGFAVIPIAELYDPVSNRWEATSAMITPRLWHRATLLNNGKVLITGGDKYYGSLSSSELYDPNTGMFTVTGEMKQPGVDHQATLLADGRVLVSGQSGSNKGGAKVEMYDPITGEWEYVGSMRAPRAYHTSTLLDDGTVLLVGGYDPTVGNLSNFAGLGYTEVFNPAVVTLPLKLRMQLVGGSPTLWLIGSVGASYAVEYKNGLLDASWSPLTSFTMTTNPATVADPGTTGATTRYYRATVR